MTQSGLAAFDHHNGLVTVPLPKHDGSVQVVSVIDNATAPTEIVLELQIPHGARSELQPDGSVALRIWFDHAEGLTDRGQPSSAFEIAAADGEFKPAQARIEGETVLVSSPAVRQPMYVRYAWQGVVETNLFNAQGFPASTFTSEPEPRR